MDKIPWEKVKVVALALIVVLLLILVIQNGAMLDKFSEYAHKLIGI